MIAVIVYASIALLAACLFVAVFRKDRSEELARDEDADDLRRQVQGVHVHSKGDTHAAL